MIIIPEDKRTALLALPEDVIAYLYPGLHKKDINAILGIFPPERIERRTHRSERKPRSGEDLLDKKARIPDLTSDESDEVPDIQSEPVVPELDFEYQTELEERRYSIEAEAENRKKERILKALSAIQAEFEISVEELDQYLHYRQKPSRLRVYPNGKIILVDFDRHEVKLDRLSKVVYLLFLRHPEGIVYKDMYNYRLEMIDIYKRLADWDYGLELEKAIDRLCNTVENNSLNEKVSRIKRAFLNLVDERLARFYYIQGPAGGIRKIDLDRSLVEW